MASSRADSNQLGGTKRFRLRHAVDSNGDGMISMFDVRTVESLELQ